MFQEIIFDRKHNRLENIKKKKENMQKEKEILRIKQKVWHAVGHDLKVREVKPPFMNRQCVGYLF